MTIYNGGTSFAKPPDGSSVIVTKQDSSNGISIMATSAAPPADSTKFPLFTILPDTKFDGSYYVFAAGRYNGIKEFGIHIYTPGANYMVDTPIAQVSWNSGLSRDYFETYFTLAQGTYYDLVWYTRWNQVDSQGLIWNYEAYNWITNIVVSRTMDTPFTLVHDPSTNTISADFNNPSNNAGLVFEWERADQSSPLPYTLQERQAFYDICLRQNEITWNKYWMGDYTKLRRFTKPNVTFKCVFYPSVSTGNYSTYKNVVITIINELNSIISGSGVTLSVIDSGTADIDVRFGTQSETGIIYRENAGEWENYDSNGVLTSGLVKISSETDWSNYVRTFPLNGLLREELAQVLGSGNDWDNPINAFYFQVAWGGKVENGYTALDQKVIEILYKGGLPTGELGWKLAEKLGVTTASNGAHPNKYINIHDYLKPNTQYRWRAYAATYQTYPNIGQYFSARTGWEYFTTSGIAPFDFTYAGLDSSKIPVLGTRKQAGLGFYVPASEFKAFQDSINEVRWSRGYAQNSFFSWYNGDGSFTIPTSGASVFYYFFNQALEAIKELRDTINPALPLPSRKNSRDIIYASELNMLVNTLNALI